MPRLAGSRALVWSLHRIQAPHGADRHSAALGRAVRNFLPACRNPAFASTYAAAKSNAQAGSVPDGRPGGTALVAIVLIAAYARFMGASSYFCPDRAASQAARALCFQAPARKSCTYKMRCDCPTFLAMKRHRLSRGHLVSFETMVKFQKSFRVVHAFSKSRHRCGSLTNPLWRWT